MNILQNELKLYSEIVFEVANFFEINPEIIILRSNKKKPSHARHIVAYSLYRNYELNSYKVGLLMNRDRRNVMHSVSIIENDVYGKSKNQITIDCLEYLKSKMTILWELDNDD